MYAEKLRKEIGTALRLLTLRPETTISLLRIGLSIVYGWFGLLKVMGISPAEGLIAQTVYWCDSPPVCLSLGIYEILIGIFLLFRPTLKVALPMLYLHMIATFTPFIIIPEVCFDHFPIGLSLEGQYIIKNLVLVSAALTIASTSLNQTTKTA